MPTASAGRLSDGRPAGSGEHDFRSGLRPRMLPTPPNQKVIDDPDLRQKQILSIPLEQAPRSRRRSPGRRCFVHCVTGATT